MSRRHADGLMHRTHYAPGGGPLSWCGRAVGWHTAIPATENAERVTCRSCLRVMRRFASGVESWQKTVKPTEGAKP